MRKLWPTILLLLLIQGIVCAQDDERAWAYRTVHRPAIPVVKTPDWVSNPVDAFILKSLQDLELHPSPPASRHTLVRLSLIHI